MILSASTLLIGIAGVSASLPPAPLASGATDCLASDATDFPSGATVQNGEMTLYSEWNNGRHTCVDDPNMKSLSGNCFVAIGASVFGMGKCGQSILAKIGGKLFRFKVSDKCMGCKPGDLDLTSDAFTAITGQTTGRYLFSWAWEGTGGGGSSPASCSSSGSASGGPAGAATAHQASPNASPLASSSAAAGANTLTTHAGLSLATAASPLADSSATAAGPPASSSAAVATSSLASSSAAASPTAQAAVSNYTTSSLPTTASLAKATTSAAQESPIQIIIDINPKDSKDNGPHSS